MSEQERSGVYVWRTITRWLRKSLGGRGCTINVILPDRVVVQFSNGQWVRPLPASPWLRTLGVE